jgi:transcriptional regulator GlxA family with amidase domain
MTEQIAKTPAQESLEAAVVPSFFIRELDEVLAASSIRRRHHRRSAWCVAGEGELRRSHRGSHRPDLPARLGRVVAFIDDHLEGPLSLDRLADEAGLSTSHFARLFRDEVGETPWAYVRNARLRKAKALLEQGTSPVAAALEAGFYDQSHLTNVMKEVEGKTPKQYQQERRENEDHKDLQE